MYPLTQIRGAKQIRPGIAQRPNQAPHLTVGGHIAPLPGHRHLSYTQIPEFLREVGADFFDKIHPLKVLFRLTKRIESLGYFVQVAPIPVAA